MKKTLRLLLMLVSPIFLTSCPGNDPIEPETPTLDVAQGILGTWLLSSSDANNWIAYEFTQANQIRTEIARQGYLGTGEGFYSILDTKLTGSYTTDRSQTFYLDWYVNDIQPFEIGLDIYNENTYVGQDALYIRS